MGRLDPYLFGSAAGLLNKSVSLQLTGEGTVAGADALKEGMELRTVVEIAQVAELVQHDIVLQVLRKAHYVEIEIDVAELRATAPVGDVVLDAYLVVGEAMAGGELGQAGRQGRLGLDAQPLHLCGLFGRQGFSFAPASADKEKHSVGVPGQTLDLQRSSLLQGS